MAKCNIHFCSKFPFLSKTRTTSFIVLHVRDVTAAASKRGVMTGSQLKGLFEYF